MSFINVERDPPRRERRFARAAAERGPSRSALSHAMLGLEARLRVRLLTRTTRRVISTDVGIRLLNARGQLVPGLEEWWPLFPNDHLYYASRRQLPPALALAIDTLCWRERRPRGLKSPRRAGQSDEARFPQSPKLPASGN
ncbi:LysR family transcriptional regulator [Burkholderia ambifaria]|nr:LysR family transcriptional regulator [Burkholderia ambifaria]